MRSYTYKFVWKNKEGVFEKCYIEAANRDAAIEDFEKSYSKNMKRDKVVMKRLTGGDTE